MPESADRAVEMSFPETTDVLMAACGAEPGARSAFAARVRHLQRLGLPPRGGLPANARLVYGLAEMAAIATAFRLMDAFLLPTIASRYVLERWTELTPWLVAGAVDELPAGYAVRRPLTGGRHLVLQGSALAELGRKAAHEGRYDGRLGKVSLHGDAVAAVIAAAAGGAGTVVDSASFMPALVAAMRRKPDVSAEHLVHELDRLRLSRAVPAI